MVTDIREALAVHGLVSPEGLEVLTDEILQGFQASAGLVGNIRHQSDGKNPTTIYAITGDDLRSERRLTPSTWDQWMEGVVPDWDTEF
jgi:hypothetical protein